MSSSDSDENDSNLSNLKEAIAPELLSCMSSHNSKSNSQSQLNSVSSDSLKGKVLYSNCCVRVNRFRFVYLSTRTFI